MPTDPEKLSITIDPDGIATLTGLDYRDLRSFLTAASLYRRANRPKADPVGSVIPAVIHQNNLENFRWHLDARHILDVLEVRLGTAINPENVVEDLSQVEKVYAANLDHLEQTVREAEVQAAGTLHDGPSPVEQAAQALASALKDADTALAALMRARAA